MTLPTAEQIRTIINAPCLVKIDRAGRALYVSDYARRLGSRAEGATQRLKQAGFVVSPLEDGMSLVDWPLGDYLQWYASQPLPPAPAGLGRRAGLYHALTRHPAPLDQQDGRVLAQALLLARLKRDTALFDLLEGAYAKALRERRAPPHHGARVLYFTS